MSVKCLRTANYWVPLGPDHAQQNHYLRVYMGMLRRKLEIDSTRPRYLLTEPGIGYRLAAE